MSEQSIYSGRAIVEDLLTVIRLERRSLPLSFEQVPATRLLIHAISRYRSAFGAKNITVAVPATGSALVSVDRELFERVLSHLLENALRYTPEGGQVDVGCQNGDGVELTIANNGPKIPESERDRIFEKFAQHLSPSTAMGKAGLGLYVCRRIVELHNGTIDLVETPLFPVCFRIRLPHQDLR